MTEFSASPSRFLKVGARLAHGLWWLVVVSWIVLALAWAGLHWWIVPGIGDLRPRVERQTSAALGVPVRIGAISAQSGGLIPSFALSDVTLLDTSGQVALRLPKVSVLLSAKSLLRLGFEQITLERPELDVRRAKDGRIFVAGLDMSRSASADQSSADWFFAQSEFIIRDGQLTWHDELLGAAPLALKDVDVLMRNGPRSHLMRLEASPPSAWGQRFSVTGRFRQPLLSTHAGQVREWDGQVFADFPLVDVQALRQHAKLEMQIHQGRGALRTWLDVTQGQFTGITTDIALNAVDVQLGERLHPLALTSVTGRIAADRKAGGFSLATQGLQFRTAGGLQWPGGDVSVVQTASEGQIAARGELTATRLDLTALSHIADSLPLGTVVHSLIDSAAPKGLVETLSARWIGDVLRTGSLPSSYEARGRVSGFGLTALRSTSVLGTGAFAHDAPGRPGVRGMSADFELTQSGGLARVAVTAGALELPGALDEAVIPLDQLSAELRWQISGAPGMQRVEASVNNLKIANAHAQGEGQVSWHTGEGAHRLPGVLDVRASFSRVDGTKVHRYLPAGIPKATRDYLREAIVAGTASAVKIKIKGDAGLIPYADPKAGDFHIEGQVHNVHLAYAPKALAGAAAGTWPPLTAINGLLTFDHNAMAVSGASGRIGTSGSLVFSKAEARIPSLAQNQILTVTAEPKGPLTEALQVINTSPLAGLTSGALARASANGPADLRLRLTLPLLNIDRSKVQGSLTLVGNDVQISPETPALSRARGVVTFSETGFALVGVQARAFGGDVRIEGGLRPSAVSAAPGLLAATGAQAGADAGGLSLRFSGSASAEGLRAAKELGPASRLAQSATGSANYTANLVFKGGFPEITLASNLQGMGLSLPAPLAKPADAVLPLRFENTALAPVGGRPRDQLIIELGRLAHIQYIRDLGGAQPRVLRGSMAVGLSAGESAPLPETGVVANVNLQALDIDAWERTLSKATGVGIAAAVSAAPSAALSGAVVAASTPTAAPVAPLAPANAALGAQRDAAAVQSYLPTVLAIRARELTVEGRTLNNLVIGGSREGLIWRANLDARELSGYLEYRQPSGNNPGRVYARLARLSLENAQASDIEATLNEQPASIPALDVVVEDLELRGRKFGRVEVEAVNRGLGQVAREGGVREWRLNKLNVILPEATLSASGNWVAINAQSPTANPTPSPATSPALAGPRGARPAEPRRTVMNFKLEVADSGELLKRFGMPGLIKGGKAHLDGTVGWIGSPASLDYPSLNGNFGINVEAGQFLKADPGIAKLLGVLSLQSLPRRLTLDFRDVFSEGFAFDYVRGSVTIASGVASTNNLQTKGVNAGVLMEGKADIARETQDIRVVVVPEINAGTASLLTTIINPALGLGTFLAQLILRRPVIAAATQEFHIDGSWADPRVTRVPRKVEPAPPAAVEPKGQSADKS